MLSLQDFETTTERLRLRVLDGSFAQRVVDYYQRNEPHRGPWSPLPDARFFDVMSQRARLDEERARAAEGQMLKVWLFARGDAKLSQVLGFASLSNIVRGAFQSCFLGYEIDANVINRGLMTEAIAELVRVAFEDLGLHRIEANIIPRNARSIRVVEKLGFTCEGVSPKYLQINGVWEDHAHYVLRNAAME